jgi:hypothetical protein
MEPGPTVSGRVRGVEGAAKDVDRIHFFLDVRAAVRFLFAFQHGPAIGNDDQAAADLHDGNGDSKEMQDVRADKEGGDQQDKAVQSDLARQGAACWLRILASQGEKHGAAAKRIDDGKQSSEDEQDTFGDFQGILRRGEYSRGEAFAGFLVRRYPPTPGCFVQRVCKCMKGKGMGFARVQKTAKECARI